MSPDAISKCEPLDSIKKKWSPRQESNLYLALRRHSFYPLNYREGEATLYDVFRRLPLCFS